MATRRISILGAGTVPDTTGECFFEPYSILATNNVWGLLIARYGSDNTAAPTVRHGLYGQFQVPQDYVSAANLVIVWTSTLTSGDVEWDFDYRAVGGNDTESLDQSGTQETVNTADTAPSAAHERMTASVALTDGNFAAGDTVEFYLARDGTDAGDTLAGSALLVDAYFEYADALPVALDFTAATDRVVVSADTSIDDLDAFTILIWAWIDNKNNADRIWGKVPTGTGNGKQLFFDSSLQLYLFVDRATVDADAVSTAAEIATGKWVFIAATFDEADGARLYIGDLNTLAVESSYTTRTVGSGDANDDTDDMLWGNWDGTGGSDDAVDGRLARGMYFNARLTEGQVWQQQFRPTNTAECVNWLEFGYNGTGTQSDWSGNGNSGTVTGAAQYAHAPLAPPPFIGAERAYGPAPLAVISDPVLEWATGISRIISLPLEWESGTTQGLRGSQTADSFAALDGALDVAGSLRGAQVTDDLTAATGSLTVLTVVDVQPALELQAVSVWTDFEAAGGVAESVFTLPQILAAEDVSGIDGEERLRVTVQRSAAAWSDVQPGKVLRTEFQTTDFDEWRIRACDSARGAGVTGSIECEGPVYDLLRRSGLVEVTESDGFTDHDIQISNLTPTQWFSLAEDSPNFPAWIKQGTIEPVTRVTIPISGDTPRKIVSDVRTALDTLNEQKPNYLLRRVGTLEYRLDFLSERGSDSEVAFVGSGINLAALTHREEGAELATQCYVFGGGARGSQLSMQHHRFKLANVGGTTVDLTQPDGSSDEPIKIDDMLNGLTLENITRGDSAAITDTAITNNRLTFGAVPGTWANDDMVVVRRDSDLNGLNWLEHPARKATYGPFSVKVDRPDIVGVDNLMSNALLTDFTAGLPDGWTAIGGAVLEQETERPWWLHGGSSLKITAKPGEGVVSDAIDIDPTVTNPYHVAQLWLIAETLATGHIVKCQIEEVDTGLLWPNLGNKACVLETTLAPTMVPILSGINWQLRGTTQLKLHVTVEGTGNDQSTIYLDAAQLFRGVNPAQNIHEGYASNRLWSLAQDVLLGGQGTPIDQFDVQVTDLNRVNETAYPHSAITVGGTVVAKDEALGIDVSTRIVKRTRNLKVAGDTRVTLSDKRRDLVGMIGKRNIRPVIDASPPISGDPVSSGRGISVMNVAQGATMSVPQGAEFFAGCATGRIIATTQPGFQVGDLYAIPFTVASAMTIDRASVWVQSDGASTIGGVFSYGAGSFRLGVYRDTGNTYPGNTIYASADVTVPAGLTRSERTLTGLSIDLEPGMYYWAALQCVAVTNPGSEGLGLSMFHRQSPGSQSTQNVVVMDTMRPILGVAVDPFPGSGAYAIGVQVRNQGGTMPNPFPLGGAFLQALPFGLPGEQVAGPAIKFRRSS